LPPPYNSKYTPYVGGTMNDGDQQRFLAGLTQILTILRDASSCEEMDKCLEQHDEVYSAFAKVAPLLRTPIKLDESERAHLIQYIFEFDVVYNTKTTSAPTPKMRHIAAHAAPLIRNNHNMGLFSEDSMESIHAEVNRLTSTCCTIPGDVLVH
jgi:hypothetical protein